ncbi:MAG: hypothetical protein B7Z78_12785 [Rhodospirillales bacterium 20-60-12]|nr:MAG: hypothetical protein B7Z78_12785 [Rhodospirillales bacterium 20-60-12]HQT67057.1 hypothetical protein [Acetobacteraceae bacterium]
MRGRIADLLGGPYPADRQACRDIFGPQFQTIAAVTAFLQANLRQGSVHAQLTTAQAGGWSVTSFQALYVACWLHHPVEKGTYLIDLSGLSLGQMTTLNTAFQQHLRGRKSSHLSGAGRSAGQGWAFMNGYQELLVQIETLKGVDVLMLKSEGHQVSLTGIIPHAASFVKKKFTGSGAQASASLNAYSNLRPDLVSGRAAENYAIPYEDLIKWLKLSGKMITIREVMYALFKKVKYPPNTGLLYTYFSNMDNANLGAVLRQYINAARNPGGAQFTGGGKVTVKMLASLSDMADALIADGNAANDRIFLEVRATGQDIDASLQYFYNQQDFPMPVFAVG